MIIEKHVVAGAPHVLVCLHPKQLRITKPAMWSSPMSSVGGCGVAGYGSAPGHTRLRHRNSDNNLRARVCVYMAGLLAEQKYHGPKWRLEGDVVQEIRAVRAGQDEGAVLDPSDLRAVALALLDDEPPISLAAARRAVVYCQEYTEALLDDPRVWGGLERVAKALYRRRYLSPRAVKQVLGDAFFADVKIEPVTSS